MDVGRQEPEQKPEFQFIEEKVVPRRKGKIKRVIISLISTVVLAVVFGFVARYIFIISEPWLYKLLGINTSEKIEFKFPSVSPSPTIAPTPTPNPTPTPTLTDTPDVEKEPPVVETHIDPTAEDYAKMFQDMKQIASSVYPSLVTVTAVESRLDWFNEVYENENFTTGIIIEINMTNVLMMASYYEIKDASFINVKFSDGLTLGAELINYDEDFDVAILSINVKELPEETLVVIKEPNFGESYTLNAGMPILALGNPNGYTGSIDIGMISRKAGYKSVIDGRVDLYHTNLIYNSNSGGVILNMSGEIVACITQVLFENKGDTVSTIVGISRLLPVVERLVNKADCIYFGIIAIEIPKDYLAEAGIENGVYIMEMETGSPAFNAGIKLGDIITEIDGFNIFSVGEFAGKIAGYAPGSTINVKVKRVTKQVYKDVEFEVTLSVKE